MTTKANKPSWLANIVSDEKISVEPFAPTIEKADLKDFAGYLVIASSQYGTNGKKVAVASRIEEDLMADIKKCQGSNNAVLNALLRYAINDLKAKNKTLYS